MSAVLIIERDISEWWASIASLLRLKVPVTALSGYSAEDLFGDEFPDVEVQPWSLSEAVGTVSRRDTDAVLVVTAPVIFPVDALDRALGYLDSGAQVGTVSFLSNSAGYLSFPYRNQPVGLMPEGHDESSVTRVLRASGRRTGPTPIPVPAGSAVLIPAAVLRFLGIGSGIDPDVAVLDLGLRAVTRGFVNMLDSSTFVTTPERHEPRSEAREDVATRGLMHARHPFFPGLYDIEKNSSDGPLADDHQLRKAELVGIDVLVDGSCFGPIMQGTQVAVMANIRSLADHPAIRRVVVALPAPTLPPLYLLGVLDHPKVSRCHHGGGQLPDAPPVDVVHRPFQSHGQLPLRRWHQVGRRLVLTVQDLIAYNNGYYHPSTAAWVDYRTSLAQIVGHLDAVVAISEDTKRAITEAAIAPFPERIRVVPNGTDHLSDMHGRSSVPSSLMRTGNVAMAFILVLGTSYAHKNRDLAIRAWQELRRRGSQLELVLAGVVVPLGSTRNEEALAFLNGWEPIVLPDVSEEERNWLLEHAAVVLYPTSAEGFGLVPFEAAEFDTPTVFVSFGPLAEFLGSVPVVAADWTPAAIADAIAVIERDPAAAAAQVAAVREVSAHLSWDGVAVQLVEVYLDALARPRARVPDALS